MRLNLLLFGALIITAPVSGQNRNLFEFWDKNKDGKLSKEELPRPAQRNFERVDQDGDGFISKREDAAFRNRGGGIPQRSPLSAGVKKLADLDYAGNDNPKQKLDLYLPAKPLSDGPLPVVCWIHGGGWKNGDKANARKVFSYPAGGKYAAASIGYRLSGEAQWPSQIQDCKAAIRFLKANAEKYNLDPDRIAVWGSSAGGHLVAMLGVSDGVAHLEGDTGPNDDQNSKVACVVDYYGPTELLLMNKNGSTMDHDSPNSPESLLVGGPIQENSEKTRDASPVHHVTKDDSPVLLVHGTDDPLVPYQQSVVFEKSLENAGVAATLVTIEKAGHGKGFPARADEIVRQFLDFHLLKQGEAPVDQTLGSQ
ncbi:MAG: alpha/beta fold hydrolase [Verrucomicrobiales bacterium]|nr:alpha/beta fold hydrolase [Verrucomicrobiales bacterium]